VEDPDHLSSTLQPVTERTRINRSTPVCRGLARRGMGYAMPLRLTV